MIMLYCSAYIVVNSLYPVALDTLTLKKAPDSIEYNAYLNPYYHCRRYVHRSYCKSIDGQSSLRESFSTERSEAGRPSYC